MTATQTFSYTGAAQSWVVPAGVSTVSVSCLGAVGGGYNGTSKGGSVSGTLNVTPGETLWMYPGGSGAAAIGGAGGTGGWNGGAAGGTASGAGTFGGGAGGGGGSDIRQGGTALTDRVCVAGGGAGRTTNVQGAHGGASIGQTGPGSFGGGGGTQSSGGAVVGGGGGGATNGSLGSGGHGGGNSGSANPHYGGGGGGGGYYGGAGGGLTPGTGANWSSGGGGSNFVDGLVAGTTTNVQGDAAATSDGSITLTWNPPPNAPTIIKPAASANLDSTIAQTFSWSFSSADPTATLTSSQLQYRATAANSGYGAIDSVNLCANPNFETDLSGWAPTGSPAPNVYRITTRSHSGSASLEISSRGASSFLPGAYFTASGLTIGLNYTVSAYVYVPSGNPEVGVYAFGKSFGTSTGTLVDQWVRISYTFLADATSNGIGFWQNSTASGQIADIDDVLLEVGSSANPYFDGNSTAQIYPVTVTYAWTGAVNNSFSTRTRAWNSTTIGSGGTTKSYPALTFANLIQYEWEVNSTDNDALTGPYSALRTFTASQPVTNMAATAGMTPTASLTVLAAQPLAAKGQLNSAGVDTLLFNSALSALGALALTGSDTTSNVTNMAAIATIGDSPSHTLPFVSAMSSLSKMILSGFDSSFSTVNFAATVQVTVQVTLGVVPITTFGSMSIAPQFITKGAVQPMVASSQLVLNGLQAKGGSSVLAATAVLAFSGQTLRFPSIPMAIHGSLSQSGTVSRSLGLPVAARAILSSQGLVQLTKAQPLAARGTLVVVGARNAIGGTSFLSHGAMVLVASPDQIFSALPLAALARLSSATTADTISIVNHMQALASLILKDSQSIIGHTYLVVPSVNGSVLTFTASGYPNPTNSPSANSVGNVAP